MQLVEKHQVKNESVRNGWLAGSAVVALDFLIVQKPFGEQIHFCIAYP